MMTFIRRIASYVQLALERQQLVEEVDRLREERSRLNQEIWFMDQRLKGMREAEKTNSGPGS
jgi:uncharacterized coiled-coil DUF342 family protein